MSGPIRQPLADVASVTPTLSDKAVTIQANTVRTSSYTAIYNLFKAGFDTVYATIAALNTKLSLTGGTMSGAIAMGTAKITGLGNPTLAQDAATKTYVDTAASTAEANANAYTDGEILTRQPNYDLINTGSGTTTATINATSGVATFTQVLTRKTSANFQINNTSIALGDFVEFSLYYTGVGYPVIMHYNTIANKIIFHIANIAVDGGAGIDTNANLVVTFRKI